MATIREISVQAGVSIATVSKVLNGKPGVKQSTAEEILRIADKMKYRPNLNARSLKNGQSRTLGIITEDLTVFNAPEIVDGIAAACEARGYHYILGNLRFYKIYGNKKRDPKESMRMVHAMVDEMLSKQVTGIVYIGCHSHLVVSLSEHTEIPFVCAYCTSADSNIPYVLYDDRKAAFEATEVLIRSISGPIGMITGPSDSIHAANRTRGFQEALFAHGIPYDPNLTLCGDWGRDCGYRLGSELILAGAKAILAQNDIIATGVLDWCNQNSVEVGRDVMLIGFDNREISTVCRPTLSTVALPLYEIGQIAGNTMLDILDDNPPTWHEKLLDCTIVERESTGGKK